MKHLNLDLERLEQRIAPGVVHCGGGSASGSKGSGSGSGSKGSGSGSGSKGSGSRGSGSKS